VIREGPIERCIRNPGRNGRQEEMKNEKFKVKNAKCATAKRELWFSSPNILAKRAFGLFNMRASTLGAG
jgi:hypothetical protein